MKKPNTIRLNADQVSAVLAQHIAKNADVFAAPKNFNITSIVWTINTQNHIECVDIVVEAPSRDVHT